MAHKYLPGIASDKCQFPVSGREHCLKTAAEHDFPAQPGRRTDGGLHDSCQGDGPGTLAVHETSANEAIEPEFVRAFEEKK